MNNSNTTPEPIDEAWVTATAALAGLRIEPEHVPGVVAYLRRIAALAAAVNDTPLDPDDELGPVWKS